jgi:hypothetical protein
MILIGAVLTGGGVAIGILLAVTAVSIAAAVVLGILAVLAMLAGMMFLGLAISIRVDRRQLRQLRQRAAAAVPCGEDGDPCECRPPDPVDAEIEQMIRSYRKGGGRG